MKIKWMHFVMLVFIQTHCNSERAYQNMSKPVYKSTSLSDYSRNRNDYITQHETRSIAQTSENHTLSTRSSIPRLIQSTTELQPNLGSTGDAISKPTETHELTEISSAKAKYEKAETDDQATVKNKTRNVDTDDKNKLDNSDSITANEVTVIETVNHVATFTNFNYPDVKGPIQLYIDELGNVEGKQISDSLGGVDNQAIGSIPVPSLNDTGAPSFQWHVGIYSKNWMPYMQICGGSLVKRDYVVSAAHCFWNSEIGLQPASQFAVAGGKLYRPWSDQHDVHAQRSDILEIILPVRFHGSATSFQDDIAVLRLTNPFTFALGVQPACLDFNEAFDREQLRPGNLGTVAGWGLTEENGVPSQRLNYLKLPYVDIQDCFAASNPDFYKYITSDKICAGTNTGKALCRGDSGGGLIFFSNTVPYLRGIASTAARNENLCNAYTLATFTHIYAQRSFLKNNIPDIEECPRRNVAVSLGSGCVRFCRFNRSWRCRKCCRRTRECCRSKERYHWCKN